MDFFLKVTDEGYVALAKDGSSAYNIDLYARTDRTEPREGDMAASVVAVFGRRLPDPE